MHSQDGYDYAPVGRHGMQPERGHELARLPCHSHESVPVAVEGPQIITVSIQSPADGIRLIRRV